MKKFILAICAGIIALGARAQEYPELGAKLEQYFAALAGEPAAVQNNECDFLIESCRDSLVRQYVALKIYDHYLRSKIMGDDAVAVHVAQKWFLSGKVKMHSEDDLRNADIYATFNRSSLIGQQAPAATLKDRSGATVSVPVKGEYTVLYFYAPDCSTCKATSAQLKKLVDSGEYAFRLVDVNVNNPGPDEDWQMNYGVLKTPWMFLIGPSGKILGRGLDVPSLKMLLGREYSTGTYVYGSDIQMERYSQMFDAYGDTLKVSDVLDVADYMAARTFGEGDIDSFKQVEGDLLYFLAGRREEVYKDAIIPFADKYLDVPDVWTEPSDTANVISLGHFLADITSRTPVGSRVPDLKVPGVLRRKPCLFAKDGKEGEFALRKLRGKPAYVVFYTGGCNACKETLDDVAALIVSKPKARVLLVDMDELMSSNPDLAETLLETFDLTAMPFILELDKKGNITHRYVDLSK